MREDLQDTDAILVLALKPGEILSPTALLEALQILPSQLAFLSTLDPPAGPFEALREQFPALQMRRCRARDLRKEEIDLAVHLTRWSLEELRSWTTEADPLFLKFAAVVVVLNELGWNDSQWTALPDNTVSAELLRGLSAILRAQSISISLESSSARKREGGVLTAIANADEAMDWVTIYDYWQQLEPWICGSCLLEQAVPCMARFNPAGLADVTNQIPSIYTAYCFAMVLCHANRLKLAQASASPRFRFAAVLSLKWRNTPFEEIEEGAVDEFSMLLEQVAADSEEWPKWMNSFNKHPSSFVALQRPLGRALASAPQHAIAAYIESVELFPWPIHLLSVETGTRPSPRESVTRCLREFASSAERGQREILWRIANDRWTTWDFGLRSKLQGSLGSIVGSELDYALVGYTAECLSKKENKARAQALVDQVKNVENDWHTSLSSLRNQRYSLLSALQPLFADKETDWLYFDRVHPDPMRLSAFDLRRLDGRFHALTER